jgi:hypothetical protein
MLKLTRKLAHLSPTDSVDHPRSRHGEKVLVEFVARLEEHPELGVLGSRTEQWARLLRNAYRVFGGDLRKLLLEHGPTKIYTLAKFTDGPRIIERGWVQVPGGPRLRLEDASCGDLERALTGRRKKRRRAPQRTKLPGALFSVPGDLARVREVLWARLKSLRRFDEAVGPRIRIDRLDEGDREKILELAELLNVYVRLVEVIGEMDLEKVHVGGGRWEMDEEEGGGRRYLRGTVLRDRKLVGMLRRVKARNASVLVNRRRWSPRGDTPVR